MIGFDTFPAKRVSMVAEPLREPPRQSRAAGGMRRVGVEIKFAGLTPEVAATTVAASTNGVCKGVGDDEFRIAGGLMPTVLIRFEPRGDSPREGERSSVLASIGQAVAKAVVPVVEFVTEPAPYRQLQQFNLAVDALRRAGARDSAAFGLASFGTHLNVEIATAGIDWLTRMIKAYALSEMWLRRRLLPDFSRRAAPYILPWPPEYSDIVLANDYWPPLARLIDDYLAYNPTSHRDLDLLPLFASLDPGRVRAARADAGVLAREAFHFRLPSTRIAEDGWSPVIAWNMWVRVEELAEDEGKIRRLGDLWREHRRHWFVEKDWPETLSEEFA